MPLAVPHLTDMTRRPWSLVERDSDDHGTTSYNRQQLIVEAWGQGFNCGSIVILLLFVLCNYRPGVLLHKLILLEVSPPVTRTIHREGSLD